MKTVQLAIHDSEYAQSLRSLLLRDGQHQVYLVERPDLRIDGVVVIDQGNFQSLSLHDAEPDRFVVVTRKGTDQLSKVWDAGIRHVVFEEDSPNTAQLAIIAAELRLPRTAPLSQYSGTSGGGAGKLSTRLVPTLPPLASPRSRRCGLRNANN